MFIINFLINNHKDSICLQQQKHHGRSKEKKKNTPNCFVKAFRWYTEVAHILIIIFILQNTFFLIT